VTRSPTPESRKGKKVDDISPALNYHRSEAEPRQTASISWNVSQDHFTAATGRRHAHRLRRG